MDDAASTRMLQEFWLKDLQHHFAGQPGIDTRLVYDLHGRLTELVITTDNRTVQVRATHDPRGGWKYVLPRGVHIGSVDTMSLVVGQIRAFLGRREQP